MRTAWIIALVASLGSLYAEHQLDIPPCSFCWWQRAMLFPLVPALAVGLFFRLDCRVLIPLPFIGALFAITQLAFGTCSAHGCGLFLPISSLIAFLLIALALVTRKW